MIEAIMYTLVILLHYLARNTGLAGCLVLCAIMLFSVLSLATNLKI